MAEPDGPAQIAELRKAIDEFIARLAKTVVAELRRERTEKAAGPTKRTTTDDR